MEQKRQVPFFNYSALSGMYQDEYLAVFQDVMRRGAFILQRDLEEFESSVRRYLNVPHFYGVADGTNALVIALHCAGIGRGDEVIVPSHTYVASAASIHLVGATPILVECGDDHLIDVESARSAITSRTKAIMPVHLNGRTCDMHAVMALAKKHNILVIEDAAQAFGATFEGKTAGSFGLAGTFSFYPAKVLGCFGDGGGITISDREFASKIYAFRDHGRTETGSVDTWGTNCRLDNLQAAFLSVRLRHLDKEIARRREIATLYQDGLGELSEMQLPPAPGSDPLRNDTFQNYEVQADKRDQLRTFLEERGIRALIQWGGKAVHQITGLGFKTSLPKTDRLFTRCCMLPMNPSLSDADIGYVIETIRSFYRGH